MCFSLFSIAITSLGEERANLSALRAFFFALIIFVCFLFLFVSGKGCGFACGTPWTVLLPFWSGQPKKLWETWELPVNNWKCKPLALVQLMWYWDIQCRIRNNIEHVRILRCRPCLVISDFEPYSMIWPKYMKKYQTTENNKHWSIDKIITVMILIFYSQMISSIVLIYLSCRHSVNTNSKGKDVTVNSHQIQI